MERNAPPGPQAAQPSVISFSNRPVPGQRNQVVVLLDELNTLGLDVSRARRQLLDVFAKPEMNAGTALYVLSTDLRILRDFTVDRTALANALSAHRPAPQFLAGGSELNGIEDIVKSGDTLKGPEQMIADARAAYRVRATLRAFEMIAAHVAGLPGRKTLIWITSAPPFTIGFDPESFRQSRVGERSFYDEALRATQVLSDADITVDVVDARGVQTDNQMDIRRRRSAHGVDAATAFSVDRNYEAMTAVAQETGGEVFRNTNEIGHAVERAVEGSAVTYALGFYAASEELDGHFHAVKVSVNRHGAQVRCRAGFLAVPDAVMDGRGSQPLAVLLNAPLARAEISLRTELEPASPGQVGLTAHIGPQGVTLREENGKWKGTLEWLAVPGRDGIFPAASRQLHVALTADAYHEFAAHGLTIRQSIPLGSGDNEIGLAVRDAGTGATGTLRLYRQPSVAATGQ